MAKVTLICLNNEKYMTFKMDGETFSIAQKSLEHIDLADYINIEYTEHSTSGEMTITNNSDRVVHISGWISVDDSDGTTWEETFDEELDSNDSTTIQVSTDGYNVSYWYGHVYAEAEEADDYEWDY